MAKDSTTLRQLEIIGEHIRNIRTSLRFSQVGLAARAGFTGAYYSAIERGKLNVSMTNLVKVAKALGVEVGTLFPPIAELAGEDESETHEGDGNYSATEPREALEGASSGEGQDKGKKSVFLSAGAAAQVLGINRRTLERWVHDGSLLPAAVVEDPRGKQYSVFLRHDIERFAKTLRRDEVSKGGS